MKSVFKLDRTSNRFRICPNCGKEHMVKHLGRDFCDDKCADDHYNQERRLKKQAETMLSEKLIDVPVTSSLGGPVENLPEVDQAWGQAMKTNLAILDNLSLDPKHGSSMSIDSLLLGGFNFTQYTMQGKNHNIPDGIQSSFLIFGDYRIYRIDYSKVLIKKI
ncbi:MAG: hypothetical protein ACXVPU_12290 [Bacteroidia bacterium]